MKKAIDSQALCALIGTRRLHALRDALARENKVDIARFLGELAPEQAVLGAVNYARLIFTYPDCSMMALTVALTMFCTVVIAKTIGGVLPLVAGFFHADPAIMAAPLITTIVDALALVIYFSFAVRLLPL